MLNAKTFISFLTHRGQKKIEEGAQAYAREINYTRSLRETKNYKDHYE